MVGAAAQSRLPFSLQSAFGFLARELLPKPIAVASAGAMDIEPPLFLGTRKERRLSMGHAPMTQQPSNVARNGAATRLSPGALSVAFGVATAVVILLFGGDGRDGRPRWLGWLDARAPLVAARVSAAAR
jgi:hypothetical protein